LIGIAIKDLAVDAERSGSVARPELAGSCRTYHLTHSRQRAARAGARVRRPRHFLLYRPTDDGVLEIGRVLHDSMDLDEQIPEAYRDV
jgi:toxin ParE1/3/4